MHVDDCFINMIAFIFTKKENLALDEGSFRVFGPIKTVKYRTISMMSYSKLPILNSFFSSNNNQNFPVGWVLKSYQDSILLTNTKVLIFDNQQIWKIYYVPGRNGYRKIWLSIIKHLSDMFLSGYLKSNIQRFKHLFQIL